MRIVEKIEAIKPLSKRKRVAAYARVSSGKDTMLNSLSAQISYYSEYIQNHNGWEYAGVYADAAFTGTKDSRPEFQRLLQDCREGKIDIVLSKSISRFARNTVTMLETVRELRALNIDVWFERENIRSLSSEGELMLTILAGFAQEESLSVSENCKWRIKKSYENGEDINFRHMYGYIVKNGKVEINSAQATVIRQIFDDYIGGMGCGLIAGKLNEGGIPAYFGGNWHYTHVMAIIRNERVIGDACLQKTFSGNHITKHMRANKGQLPQYYVEGAFEGIIDRETFELAQQLRIERAERYKSRETAKSQSSLTGKVVCGNCGKNYKRRKRRDKWSWQCSAYLTQGKNACPAKQIPEDVLLDLTEQFPDFMRIDVIGSNALKIITSDNKCHSFEWKDKSRADSWTDEMKEKARNKAKRGAENA